MSWVEGRKFHFGYLGFYIEQNKNKTDSFFKNLLFRNAHIGMAQFFLNKSISSVLIQDQFLLSKLNFILRHILSEFIFIIGRKESANRNDYFCSNTFKNMMTNATNNSKKSFPELSVRFQNLPVDEDTKILHSSEKELAQFKILFQTWIWDGVYGESFIFVQQDVKHLSQEEILDLAKSSPIIQNKKSITYSDEMSGFVFVNFNFRIL